MGAIVDFGYGYGYGSGDGSGYGDGSGSGDGDGDGYGYGSGYSDGSGDGSGSGDGDGYSDGSGYGDGYGSGYGDGSGDGYGSGYSDGSGYGDGDGSGREEADLFFVKKINNIRPVNIDGLLTVFDRRISANLARGYVLRDDFSLIRTFVACEDRVYAHGATLREAVTALREKLLSEMDIETKTEQFRKSFSFGEAYPAAEFYSWHNLLTGSCKQGRDEFVRSKGIDLSAEMTPEEFFKIVKGAYGWDSIEELAGEYLREADTA